MDDYYKTLGVDKSADEEVIYAAYKALAKKYNPDKGLQDEDKIKIINIAFDILSNKEKRNEYDKKIGYVEKNDNSYLNDGDYKYEGEYKDGKYHGQGTLTYPDGDKYVGEHKDGEHHGQGTYTYSDGSKYEGNWKEGVKQGQGKMTWGDGESNTYEGEYRDGKWHGKGKYVVDLGGKEETICEGIWEEGKFIKGKKITSDYMYYEGVFNNYILIKGKQVIEHPEGSSIQEGEFNLDGSDKIDFIYTEFSSILDEDECYVGTFKDNGWNDGFIIKVNTGKKIRKVENGTVYKLGFFDKF